MNRAVTQSLRSGNLLDYLAWRGDLSFSDSPWNEIDALVLATVSYADFSVSPSEAKEGQPLLDVFPTYSFPSHNQFIADIELLLEEMINCRRFQDLRILDQTGELDASRNIQFSAITFSVPDIGTVIAYRGTDSSLVGWKEDFMMSYESPVPSQTAALAYLKKISERVSGELILTGHSKGGNLAVYSAAHTSKQIQARLHTVYSFDGPGLDDESMVSDGYMRIRDRLVSLIPAESVVGLLLNYHPNYRVVRSTSTSIKQHNSFTWEILGAGFLMADNNTRRSQLLDHSVHEWLKTCSSAQRELIVNTLFALLASKSKGSSPLQQIDLPFEKPDEESVQNMLSLFYKLLTIHIGNTLGETIRKPLAMMGAELRWKNGGKESLLIRSDQIDIDNRGYGFDQAKAEVEKMAEFTGLNTRNTIHLLLLAEEMLGMVRSVTGQWNATFRVLCEGNRFQLVLTTRTLMDEKKRQMLSIPTIPVKTEPDSFRTWLRRRFEQALLSGTDAEEMEMLPAGILEGVSAETPTVEDVVRFEQSVLYRLANSVRLSIHGGVVLLTVGKTFDATNMRSAVIEVTSLGNGFTDALEETRNMAERNALSREDSLRLQLFAEEMLNLLRSVTGTMTASFWIERDGARYDLLITAETEMNRKKRQMLLASSSSGKNASGDFLEKLRCSFEKALASGAQNNTVVFEKTAGAPLKDGDWDGYEQSVLLNLADDVKIAIRGNKVKMTVSKVFPTAGSEMHSPAPAP